MTDTPETVTPNPISELNTACERINYALDRIARVGWCKGHLREGFNENLCAPKVMSPDVERDTQAAVAGPACLLGSLVTDTEFVALMTQQRQWLEVSNKQGLRDLRAAPMYQSIYNAGLPGLVEAMQALGFESASYVSRASSVWCWNDESGRQADEVIDRLAAGKQKACS